MCGREKERISKLHWGELLKRVNAKTEGEEERTREEKVPGGRIGATKELNTEKI
jgi:hypothetical protein